MREIGMNQLADKRAIVVGASRGLGRGVTEAFLAEGASVLAVAAAARSVER
jgi:NAD(P)-dependent dehydrogenase (short-subunit alcohol dehydrogenase family)